MNKLTLKKNNIIELAVTTNTKTQNLEQTTINKYKIKLKEKPIKDKANKEIINLFKKKGYLIEILKGKKSSKKLVKIVDIKQ